MTEFEDVREYKRARARAQAYTYVCARGLPAYFGILIARGRPSPLSLLTPFRRALRPVSPHLVSYRAPAPRPHPRIPVSSNPRVPLETLPIPKTFRLYAATPVTCIFTCTDCRDNIRDLPCYFSFASHRADIYSPLLLVAAITFLRRSRNVTHLDFSL